MKKYILKNCLVGGHYQLTIHGSSYNILKNGKIIKHLDGAEGHETCIKKAKEFIKGL
tara:strand:- start:1753 stop:1923 length:171 start_codon:yes stop_codon:yes gene_type:complete